MYKCISCNFYSNKKENYKRHIKTKKHLKIIAKIQNGTIKQHICVCGKSYSYKSGLYAHKSKFNCEEKDYQWVPNKFEEKYMNIKLENDQLKKQLIRKYDHSEKKDNYLEKVMKNSGARNINIFIDNSKTNTTNNIQNMNLITQANNLYPNAPNLEPINNFNYLGNDNAIDFIEDVIYYYKKNTLDEYLGEFILKHYKKKQISEQSIYNTDIPRLNFIIKTINNNISKWIRDGKGVLTKEKIICPLLDYLSENIQIYMKENCKLTNNLNKINMKNRMLEKLNMAGDIDQLIIKKSLEKDILKYIAPRLKVDSLQAEKKDDEEKKEEKEDKKILSKNNLEYLSKTESDEELGLDSLQIEDKIVFSETDSDEELSLDSITYEKDDKNKKNYLKSSKKNDKNFINVDAKGKNLQLDLDDVLYKIKNNIEQLSNVEDVKKLLKIS